MQSPFLLICMECGSDGAAVLASPSSPPEALSLFVASPGLDFVNVANIVKDDVWKSPPEKGFLRRRFLGPSPTVQVISHPLP
jgi:hypothetical protein